MKTSKPLFMAYGTWLYIDNRKIRLIDYKVDNEGRIYIVLKKKSECTDLEELEALMELPQVPGY